MSAALKATTALSGLAIFGLGAAYTLKTPQTSFSSSALAAAEHSAPDAMSVPVSKVKLPSNYFQFTLGSYKVSNA